MTSTLYDIQVGQALSSVDESMLKTHSEVVEECFNRGGTTVVRLHVPATLIAWGPNKRAEVLLEREVGETHFRRVALDNNPGSKE